MARRRVRGSGGARTRHPGEVSLERALSKLGLASRTVGQEWILAGRVRVDGRVLRNPLAAVVPERVRIELDGVRVARAERIVLLLHKPAGPVTTRSDERGRKTVFDCLPEQWRNRGHLHAVGRLDAATSGLLLLTNDTRLSAWLTDPQQEIERLYQVKARGEVTPADVSQILRGIESPVGVLRAKTATLVEARQGSSLLELILIEGKNREVRRIFEALDKPVLALKRLRFGALELGTLEVGQVRLVSEKELLAAFPGAPRATTLRAQGGGED